MTGRRLYVGRLDQDATKKDVEDYFGSHGKIVDVRLMAGFCFLEFEELKDAEQAVADFSGKDFMGSRLIVEFAKPPRNVDPDREPRRQSYDDRNNDRPRFERPAGERNNNARGGGGHRLVVNGVPEGCSWQDLKDFARGAGTVTFADVDRNNPGVGYIEYPSRSDADEAIRSLGDSTLKGVTVTVEEAAPGAGPAPQDFRGGGGGRRDDYRGGRDDYRGGGGRDDYRGGRDDYRGGGGGRRDDYRDDRRGNDYGRRDDYRRRSMSPRRDRRDDRDSRDGGRDSRDSRDNRDSRDDRRSPPPPRDRSPPRERENRSPVVATEGGDRKW